MMSLLFYLLLLLPVIFFIILNVRSLFSKRKPWPPGPKPWPVIGNLLDMGEKPHISLANLSRRHGPLISLRLGSTSLVVASSPAAAKEILKTHDKLLSDRHVPKAYYLTPMDCDRLSLIWNTQCTDQWKQLRTLCKNELFSAKAIESQAEIREKKASELLHILVKKEGKVVNVGDLVFTMIINVLSNLVFSKDFIEWENETMASEMKGRFWRLFKLVSTPNLSDFYPFLGSFDLQGLRKDFIKCVEETFDIWRDLVCERRSGKGSSRTPRDFLDVFLAHGFTDQQINALAHEIFVAGAETSTVTIEWAMAELLRNKECMDKLREELNRELKDISSIKESHISQLPYLNACVKETLRLHPPGPLLAPHRARETVEILNYTIPKNSQVAVNIWAIGRDPEVWEDPLTFRPERFLSSNMDFKGKDFEYLPFGSGRRICPGMPMANIQVNLILASLIRHFHWSLPNNEEPSKLDMTEKFGLSLHRQNPLVVIPKLAI